MRQPATEPHWFQVRPDSGQKSGSPLARKSDPRIPIGERIAKEKSPETSNAYGRKHITCGERREVALGPLVGQP